MENILKNKWTWIILGVIVLLIIATKRYSNKTSQGLGHTGGQQKLEMGGVISKAMTEFRQINKRIASKLT